MSLRRLLHILAKDLKLGPRSPMVLYAVVFPVIATVLIQAVLGDLFQPAPRLGIVDEGRSRITSRAEDLEGVDVQVLASARALKERLEANNLDAGLVLEKGFDDALRQGAGPLLAFYFAGESLARNRMLLGVAAADLVRAVAGAPAPVDVAVEVVGGGESIPLSKRLIPLLIIYVVMIGGVWVPALSLVEEKEQGTLSALLLTPARRNDIVFAKAALGFILVVAGGIATLALNRTLGEDPLALVVILAVASLMAVLIGVALGALARNTSLVFSVAKAGGILLFMPVIFYIWPDLPQWVPKLFPTYYFLQPLYEVAVRDASLADVWRELTVAVAICLALLPVVALAARRMEARVAGA